MTWRKLFPSILLFTCVDGFISNLYYPALLPLLYRDFLVLAVCLLFFFQEPAGRWISRFRERTGASVWFFALSYLLVGMVQIFNPSVPSLSVGLLGFKVAYFYWMLAVLGYAYAEDLDESRKLLRWVAMISVPINLFGLYQFYQGPDFLIDTFGPGFERAIVMSHVEEGQDIGTSFLRIIGTFASSGHFTQFLVANNALGFSLLLTAPNLRGRLVYTGILMLNFVALLATGSRGGLLTLGLSVAGMLVFCSGIRRRAWIGILIVAGLYASFHWLGESVIRRFETIRDTDLITQRTVETTPVHFLQLLNEAPFGLGMGTGTTASRYLLGEDSFEWRLMENQLPKVQLETGIFGVIFFFTFITLLGIRWVRNWRVPPNDFVCQSFVGPLSGHCLALLALSYVAGGIDSPVPSIFLWTLVGFVGRLTESPARTAT